MQRDASPGALDKRLDDRQPKARAFGAGAENPVEGVEYALTFGLRR
jgi:hypothetical protein